MRRKAIVCLMAVMLLSLALCLVGCNSNEKLQTPQNLRQEGRTVVWDKVDNAVEYIVFVGDKEYKTSENFFDLSFLPAGKCSVEVLAVGETNDSLRTEITVDMREKLKNGYDELGFYYELLEDELGYEVSSGNANLEGVVTIPDYFCDLPVKHIAEYAFRSRNTNVNYFTETLCNMVTTKLILPKNLEDMGFRACSAMVRLEEIVMPDNLTIISGSAFAGCTHLKKVNLPKSLKEIECGAFADTGLQELVIPEGVERIEAGAFECEELYSSIGRVKSDLSSIVIPDSVKYIGNKAFFGREKLSNIVMPKNLDEMFFSYNVFHDTVWYNSQPDGFVMMGDMLYRYKGTMPENSSLTIPSNVKYIGGRAFCGQENLKKAVIPDGVKLIGDQIFDSCSGLEEIVLPSDLEGLYDQTFLGCSSLERVIIPKSLKKLGVLPFYPNINVYYEGSLEEWMELAKQENPDGFVFGTVYTYLAEKPTTEGNFWHYVDAKPVAW